jgi:uncharacterized membrane protein
MVNSFGISKLRTTRWTLELAGILLLLSGVPLASYSIGTFHPYLALGASMIIFGFGFIMVLAAFVNQKISSRQTQVIIGLSGQILLGIIIFGIPLIPSVSYPFSPYNLHSYSIYLGILGIALSLLSIIMISSYDKKQNPS